MSVEQLYQDIILDHYYEKHHSGLREPFGAEVEHVNPTCGDELKLGINLDGETISDVSYEAEGCSISQASTSVMSDLVIGKTVVEAMKLYDVFKEMMEGQGQIAGDEEVLEDGIAFQGVAQFPGRVKCAMLGWSALRDAAARALAEEEK